MPRSADETRRALLDAAERRFGQDGITSATFADIIEDAGQRNNSAIQYHFGDRVGLLEAVTERRVAQMVEARDRMLEGLSEVPTVVELVEVVVHPLSDMLADAGGAAYLRIQAELLAHPSRADFPPMLGEPWSRPGLERVLPLLAERLPDHAASHAEVRATLVLSLVFHSLADRARNAAPGADHAEFVRGLVRATAAVLETPLD